MKKILVLGGTRYFGKRLVELCLKSDAEVTVGNRGMTKDHFGDRVRRVSIDRTKSGELEGALKGTEWDIVFDQFCYSSREAMDAVEIFNGRVGKYIHTSTQSVYMKSGEVFEQDFDPYTWETTLSSRAETSYGEGKRRAEAIFFQKADFPVTAPRFSLVLGEDDWSGRLEFHVNRVRDSLPFVVPNLDARVSLIHSQDAAKLLWDLSQSGFTGPVNACAEESLKIGRIVKFIEEKTSQKSLIKESGTSDEESPFTGKESRYMNSSLAENLGLMRASPEVWLPTLIERILHK